jgi:ribonuclease G
MKKILITARPWEIRIAVIANKQLQNIYFDSKHNAQLERSFIKGKIIKILPGVETAFVDINQDKAGFLHISEIDRTLARAKINNGDIEKIEKEVEDNEEFDGEESRINSDKQYLKNVSISDILKENDTLLVQVNKEPINSKGPKLTTCFTLPGRFVILMPNIPKIGISKKIVDFNERKRLKDIILSVLPEDAGCIIRTTSENKQEKEIISDIKYLLQVWEGILKKYQEAKVGDIIYQDIDLVYQVVRDNLDNTVDSITCDNKNLHDHLNDFINHIAPEYIEKNLLYENHHTPLFEHYNVERQIQKGLQSKVELTSGGSIILETTEAMTVIDVNTARFTGNHNLEDTLLKTNLEAAKEIVRQLKLRNIGGLIVIDFIDMSNNFNRNKLFSFFEKTLREEDRSQSVVLKISEFGLVQMTRKRTGKTLKNHLTKDCFYCNGTGMIKSIAERAHELLRILEKEVKEKKLGQEEYTCSITLNNHLAEYLLQKEFESILYFEKNYKMKIVLHENAENNLHAYHFEWILKKESK